jgi:hypothetical protein
MVFLVEMESDLAPPANPANLKRIPGRSPGLNGRRS